MRRRTTRVREVETEASRTFHAAPVHRTTLTAEDARVKNVALDTFLATLTTEEKLSLALAKCEEFLWTVESEHRRSVPPTSFLRRVKSLQAELHVIKTAL